MAESLGTYLDLPILRTGLVVKQTGDGLSKAMKIKPRLLKPGEKVYLLIEADFSNHNHKYIDDADDPQVEQEGPYWEVQNVVNADVVTFLTEDQAHDKIEAQRTANAELADREALAKELAKGVRRLPSAEALRGEHEAGDHTEAVDGCPLCEEELSGEAEFAASQAAISDATDIASRRKAKDAKPAGEKPKRVRPSRAKPKTPALVQ